MFAYGEKTTKDETKTWMLDTSAGATAIASGSIPESDSPDCCHGSDTKAEGFTKADSIPLPSISNNNLACMSRTIALTSCAFVPSSSLHFILSRLCKIEYDLLQL